MHEQGTFELPDIQVNARFAKPAQYSGTTKYDDYFRRKRQGFGQFIDREEINVRNLLETTEIFPGRPGIKVPVRPQGMTGGSIVMCSRCSGVPPKINVYVDGRQMYPATVLNRNPGPRTTGSSEAGASLEMLMEMKASVGEMVNRVNPADIELIEIFRGPGELPGEFNGGNCGAIAIWTRQGGR